MSMGAALAFPRGESDEDAYGADIFRQSDPRGYHRVMFDLAYGLPDTAAAVYRQVIQALTKRLGRRPRVLDLGCGYGVLPALIRYPLDMDELAHRCRDLDRSDIGTDVIVRLDRSYFSSWPALVDAEFIGWDVHGDALGYARNVGLIDHALTCDFDADDGVSAEAANLLSGVDLIISINCADFMSAAGFARMLEACQAQTTWCAVFALRGSQYWVMQSGCHDFGLVNEKLLTTTFVQRRFATTSEWTQMLLALENQGIATVGKEAEGLLHAEFHIARPAADVMDLPLAGLVALSHSQSSTYGGWRRRPWGV